MPRSVFLGRIVAEGEPAWLDEDRWWALALLEVEADSCPDCGQPWGEATDQKSEYAYKTALIKCHACAATARAVRAHENGGGKLDGLHVHVGRERG